MVKLKVLSRHDVDYTKDRRSDMSKVFRNPDPVLHPFQREKEYTRALNAVKLDKLFAKPFVGALDGHADGVFCLNTVPNTLTTMLSGACDGELRVWDIARRRTIWSAAGHRGFVRGISATPDGTAFVTCSDDKTIKMWDMKQPAHSATPPTPRCTFMTNSPVTSVDHHKGNNGSFASAGASVDVWDATRSEPLHSFTWGADSVIRVRYNAIEHQVLASTASDRSVVLYDVRARTPLHKVVLAMCSNDVCWNPREAFNFTVANEDKNLYTFDMRKLHQALCVHQDHVMAVMSVDYSPTGREFVSGSYDTTLRIFNVTSGRSREVYHTKRMQRVFAVKYTLDNKFVLSASDEFNIRLWKARASERIGTMLPREREKQNYLNKLKERYQHAPEIRRIARHRRVPAMIKSIKKEAHVQLHSRKEKERRVRAHTKAGTVKTKAARKKMIVRREQ